MMLDGLFVPALFPFTVALGLMLLIGLTEALGMLFGLSAFGLVDQIMPEMDASIDADVAADAELGGDGFLSGLLGWLCVGRVPVLVLLVAFLTAFGLTGIMLQSTMHWVVGSHVPALIAAAGALFLALPPTRWMALGLAKIMPKEETEAVSTRSFVGKVAVVIGGVARRGVPAQAKLRDVHGQMHYVLVEPDDPDQAYGQGTEVILTSQTSGIRFTAIRNENALLSTT